MRMYDLIEKKELGQELSTEEISEMIKDLPMEAYRIIRWQPC